MSTAGKYLRKTATGYVHWCPGCEEVHGIRTEGTRPPALWGFDRNFESPSFDPSVNITWGKYADPAGDWNEDESGRCHYFIRGGQIQFCQDSTHALSGKTVPLPEWPKAPGTYGGIEE
jgi:hypothetical protein